MPKSTPDSQNDKREEIRRVIARWRSLWPSSLDIPGRVAIYTEALNWYDAGVIPHIGQFIINESTYAPAVREIHATGRRLISSLNDGSDPLEGRPKQTKDSSCFAAWMARCLIRVVGALRRHDESALGDVISEMKQKRGRYPYLSESIEIHQKQLDDMRRNRGNK